MPLLYYPPPFIMRIPIIPLLTSSIYPLNVSLLNIVFYIITLSLTLTAFYAIFTFPFPAAFYFSVGAKANVGVAKKGIEIVLSEVDIKF